MAESPPRPTAELRPAGEIVRLLRDEDCPQCGWPETFAEVDFVAATPGADAIGCPKCDWRDVAVTDEDVAEGYYLAADLEDGAVR